MMPTMLPSWLAKLLAVAAVAAGIGSGVGWWLYARWQEKVSALRFEQSEIDLRQTPAIEGEPIDVVANLHNYGKVPVRITNMTTCCGARILQNEDGSAPAEIPPGASLPIRLRIGTLMSGGEAIKHARVEGQTADGLELAPAELTVFTSVQAVLTAQPQSCSFILPEEVLSAPVKQTIVLADLWPGEGLPVKSVASTLGEKLRYRLVPSHGEIGIGTRMLHKRYDLELSFRLDPSKTTFDHTVTIIPDHPKASPVEVRLFGKIIPRCRLDADSVSFCGSKPGQKFTRRLEYHYHTPADKELRLVKAPSWLAASISDSGDGVKVVTLNCTLPDGRGTRADEVCFEFGRDKKRSAVPIFVSCQPDAAKQPH